MIDHVTLQVTSVPASTAFYEVVLAPLGIAAGHEDGAAVGFFGPEPGSFWLCPAQRAEGRELHIAFRAGSRDAVRAFHEAAVGLGAEVLHRPRVFPEYHDNYSEPSCTTQTGTTSRRSVTWRRHSPRAGFGSDAVTWNDWAIRAVDTLTMTPDATDADWVALFAPVAPTRIR